MPRLAGKLVVLFAGIALHVPHGHTLRYPESEMSRTDRRRTNSVSSASPTRLKGKSIDASERVLLNTVARGEWTSIARLPAARSRYAGFARATVAAFEKGSSGRSG